MRQLAAWEEMKSELEGMECSIYAISVDNLEQATEVVDKGLTFPVAYGATKEDNDAMGSWWTEDHHGGYIQPSEFLLGRGGTVLGSMYASGPVGRMGADEAVRQIQGRERRRLEQERERQSAN